MCSVSSGLRAKWSSWSIWFASKIQTHIIFTTNYITEAGYCSVTFVNENKKCLANAKRPCDCHLLCLHLKTSTVQLYALFFRHDVIRLSWPRSWQCVSSALNANVKKFKKAWVNGGSNCGSLKDPQKSLFEPPFLDLGVTYALHL